MGNKNTKVSVSFDREVYFTHERITGTVNLDLLNGAECTNVKLISVTIKGKLVRKPNLNNSNPPWNIYTSTTHVLGSPGPPETTLTFKQGHNSWPFSIHIRDYLPPSFDTPGEHCYYYAEVVFEKPWYRINLSHSVQITICPRIILQNIPNNALVFSGQQKNNVDITVNGTLNKLGYVSGETIKCKLEIYNTKRLLIKNCVISVSHTCAARPRPPNLYNSLDRNKITRDILQQTVPSIKDTREEMISEFIDVTIPAIYIPPSFQYISQMKTYLGQSFTRQMDVSYTFKIQLKVEGFLSDVHIPVPFTIGSMMDDRGQGNQFPTIAYPTPADDANIRDDKE